MARTLHEIYSEATELSDRERAELAGMLLESLESELDPSIEAAWADEVERRIRQVDSGEVKLIPWEQVRADLFGRIDDEG
jgi:putative addiction module component (TIGR02574 family)